MRQVAVALPFLLLVATMPVALADDECRAPTCSTVSTSSVPNAPVARTFYVYGSWATCPASNQCRGSPPAFFAGTVWEETNGLPGLQRSGTARPGGIITPPDAVIVV